MTAGTVFEEASAAPRVSAVPMSHLSIELGHLYQEDLLAGPERLRAMARRVAPWAAAASADCAAAAPRARVSTCFLIDDYFGAPGSPAEVVPMLMTAAEEAGLRIDYLGRESACAQADDLALAALVVDRLVPEPPPGSNGSRPLVQESGWLCNGVRSPTPSGEAMARKSSWQPPRESAANRHSVFLDVELWHDHGPARLYSCPLLASVWQLLRLGVLRHQGQPIASPAAMPATLPPTWAELAPVTRLSTQAAPFAAYRTFSVLAGRFLGIEHAVRTVLGQVAVDERVTAQIAGRAAEEGLHLPTELVDRVDYAFVSDGWR